MNYTFNCLFLIIYDNMKKVVITISLLMLFNQRYLAQDSKFDSLITAGIHQIYSIKFNQARGTFEKVKNNYPQHPAGNFFDAMITWWEILLDLENEELDDLFVDKLEMVIDQCDDILDNNPKNIDAFFFKGGSLGFRGRLYSIRGDWFDAAADGKDALPLVFTAYELDSTNTDVKLGFGIYDYFAAVIPEKYPMVQPLMLFFPEGDRDKGIRELEAVAEKGKYAKYEAQYFLMTLNYSFERNDAECFKYAKMLSDKFPDNPRFQSFLGRINIRMNNYPTAIGIFENIIDKGDKNLIGYNDKIKREAHYYIGVNYKRSDSLDLALHHFKKCEQISRKIDDDEESGFLINAVLYQGEIYDLKGERNNAIKNYEEVLDFREFGNSYERAEGYLEKPFEN